MKKLLLFLVMLFWASGVFAATAFTVSVKQSGGDYSSLNAAMVANEVDLTAATTKVFAITGGITGTMADNTAVTGLTSGATGTCVHASSVNGQILIKSISGGPFQSGEIVYETLGVNYVTLNDAGNSPYLNVVISGSWSSPDTTSSSTAGYTTNTTNYIKISTTGLARHNGVVGGNANAYVFSNSSGGDFLDLPNSAVVYVDGVTFKGYTNGYNYVPALVNASGSAINTTLYLSNNLVYPTGGANEISALFLVRMNYSGTHNWYIWNNVVSNFVVGTDKAAGPITFGNYTNGASNIYVYNNTITGASGGGIAFGITMNNNTGGHLYFKNNLVYNCHYNSGSDYNIITPDSSTTNNLSSDATAPAYGTYYQNATVTFNNAGSGDFSLASSDTGATGKGANLSGDSHLSFSTDITGTTRTVPWDIGAFKATSTAVNHGFTRFLR